MSLPLILGAWVEEEGPPGLDVIDVIRVAITQVQKKKTNNNNNNTQEDEYKEGLHGILLNSVRDSVREGIWTYHLPSCPFERVRVRPEPDLDGL